MHVLQSVCIISALTFYKSQTFFSDFERSCTNLLFAVLTRMCRARVFPVSTSSAEGELGSAMAGDASDISILQLKTEFVSEETGGIEGQKDPLF